MAKITYYLGAGASFFACPILEKQAEMMIKLANFELQKNDYYSSLGQLSLNFSSEEKPKQFTDDNRFQILWNIGYFGEKAQEYNTIDTYARKLFLNDEIYELNRLKMSVSVFFDLWENFYTQRYLSLTEPNIDLSNYKENRKPAFYYEKIDKRYKSLFSVLLEKNENRSIELNPNFKFISWNYDLQLEETYKLFLGENSDKSFDNINNKLKFKNDNQNNNIFHLNGYRGFFKIKEKNNEIVEYEIKDDNDFEKYWNKIDFLYKDTLQENANFNNYIKYAWENLPNDTFLKNATEVMKETEVLIIIGYSFPAFNRQIDQLLFSHLSPNKVKKIIYQDPNGTKEMIENLFDDPSTFKKEIQILNDQKDLNQFYIPTEFFNSNFGEKEYSIVW